MLQKESHKIEIKIRITNGPDWNKLIAEGSTKTL